MLGSDFFHATDDTKDVIKYDSQLFYVIDSVLVRLLEDNMKMGLREVCYKVVQLIELGQDSVQNAGLNCFRILHSDCVKEFDSVARLLYS
jgi:hypothetical protein